jgi:hypothetical protein
VAPRTSTVTARGYSYVVGPDCSLTQTGAPAAPRRCARSAPPVLTLAVESPRIIGTAAFKDRPLAGFTSTLEGKRVRIFVQIDCLGCPGTPRAWTRMIGVAPKAHGTFAAFLRPTWIGRRYRATVNGPNIGTSYVPDAQVVIAAP